MLNKITALICRSDHASLSLGRFRGGSYATKRTTQQNRFFDLPGIGLHCAVKESQTVPVTRRYVLETTWLATRSATQIGASHGLPG